MSCFPLPKQSEPLRGRAGDKTLCSAFKIKASELKISKSNIFLLCIIFGWDKCVCVQYWRGHVPRFLRPCGTSVFISSPLPTQSMEQAPQPQHLDSSHGQPNTIAAKMLFSLPRLITSMNPRMSVYIRVKYGLKAMVRRNFNLALCTMGST